MAEKPRNELKEYNGLVRLRRKGDPIEDGWIPLVIDWRARRPLRIHRGNDAVN